MLDRHLPWGPIAQQSQHGVLFLMHNYAEPEAWTSKLNSCSIFGITISHNFPSLSCPACVLQRLLKWCPFSRGYDQYITNRQTGNGPGWICDTFTLLLYQMWLHLHILLVDTHMDMWIANHTHCAWHHCWCEGHLNPYQINLRGGSVSSLDWMVIGIKVHRQDGVPCHGTDIYQICGSVMGWEQNTHEMTPQKTEKYVMKCWG